MEQGAGSRLDDFRCASSPPPGIIQAQKKEIRGTQWLLEDVEQNGEVLTAAAAEGRQVPKFEVSNLWSCTAGEALAARS